MQKRKSHIKKPGKIELLFDYAQLFDILQLELLPGEEDDDDVVTKAILEYYDYLPKLWSDDAPELKAGVSVLRRLLRDLSKSQHSYISKVWKAMSEVEHDRSLLNISYPLITHMWE